MKTIRTILATFGVTTLLYGLIALLSMRLDLAFTGRSIYQLFRSTGFAALVLGIGCILSFVIMTIAIVAFRDDGGRKKREAFDEDDDEAFLEEETVPAERAEEADESWSPEIKRKQRKALFAGNDEETPDLFADDDDADYEEDEQPEPAAPVIAVQPREPEEEPEDEPEDEPDSKPEEEPEPEQAPLDPSKKRCIYCGGIIDVDSAFCNFCGKRM